jgi:hypothetical protein
MFVGCCSHLRILQWLSSIAVGFIPSVGDAY